MATKLTPILEAQAWKEGLARQDRGHRFRAPVTAHSDPSSTPWSTTRSSFHFAELHIRRAPREPAAGLPLSLRSYQALSLVRSDDDDDADLKSKLAAMSAHPSLGYTVPPTLSNTTLARSLDFSDGYTVPQPMSNTTLVRSIDSSDGDVPRLSTAGALTISPGCVTQKLSSAKMPPLGSFVGSAACAYPFEVSKGYWAQVPPATPDAHRQDVVPRTPRTPRTPRCEQRPLKQLDGKRHLASLAQPLGLPATFLPSSSVGACTSHEVLSARGHAHTSKTAALPRRN